MVDPLRTGLDGYPLRHLRQIQPCRGIRGSSEQAGRRSSGARRRVVGAAMTSALPDHLPGDDNLVLAGRPLRPGFALADTARFGEADCRPEPPLLQEHLKSLALPFQTF